MRLMTRLTIYFLFLFLSTKSYAGTPVFLVSHMDPTSINFLDHYPDATLSKTIEEVGAENFTQNFVKLKQQEASLGFSGAAHWFRFQVENSSLNDLEIYLEIAYPLLQNIQIYIKNANNDTIFTKEIIRNRISTSLISYHNYLIPLTFEKKARNTIYLRVASNTVINVPINLWDKVSFTNKVIGEMLLYGIYFGILLVMIFYNLFLFIFTLDRSYGEYILYLIGFTSMQISLQGFDTLYLWPNSPWISSIYRMLAVASTLFFALQFSRSYLNIKKYIPVLDKIIVVIMFSGIFCMIIGIFYSYSLGLKALNGLMTSSSLLIVAGFICLRRGVKPAKYFLLAWGILCIGVSTFALNRLGILPSNFFTKYSYYFGSAMEAVLLSLGLAYKISLLRQEKAHALLELKLSEEKAIAATHEIEKERMEKTLALERDKIRTMLSIGDRLNSPLTTLRNLWKSMHAKLTSPLTHNETELHYEQFEKYIKIGKAATDNLEILACEISAYRESNMVFASEEIEVTQKKSI